MCRNWFSTLLVFALRQDPHISYLAGVSPSQSPTMPSGVHHTIGDIAPVSANRKDNIHWQADGSTSSTSAPPAEKQISDLG